MEPLDEKELKQLLNRWEAPDAPASLESRIFPAQKAWWKWLWSGSIRIPVPAALAVAVLIGVWIHYSRPAISTRVAQPESVSLADFQPVRQLQPVVVVGGKK